MPLNFLFLVCFLFSEQNVACNDSNRGHCLWPLGPCAVAESHKSCGPGLKYSVIKLECSKPHPMKNGFGGSVLNTEGFYEQ